uniref:Venom serine protease n=1 Tax=Cacopsylla melanoneura TaxID=428564 RepID=A0A8D8QQ09_9HEMI
MRKILVLFYVLMVTIGSLTLKITTQDDELIDDSMNSKTRKPFETTDNIEEIGYEVHGLFPKATRKIQTNTKDNPKTLDTANLPHPEERGNSYNEELTENDRKRTSNTLQTKISVDRKKSNRIIKIINGSESRSHEFPGAICLYQRNTLLHMFSFVQYKCTGVLITPHHILTAGHCLPRSVPRFLQYTNYYLAWGGHSNTQYIDNKISKRHEISDTNFKSGEQIRTCNRWYKHPQQDSLQFIYDIGVIKCDLAFKLIPDVLEIVPIAQNFPFQEDTAVDMIGWGVFNSQNERHIYLNKYTTHILSPNACKNNYINITAQHHICTYNNASRSYKGDSGAPALYTIQRANNCRKSQIVGNSEISETQDIPGVTGNSRRNCKPVSLNIDDIFESLTNKTQNFALPVQNFGKINDKLPTNKIQNCTLSNVQIDKMVENISNTTEDNLILTDIMDEISQNQTTKSINYTIQNVNTDKIKENIENKNENFTNPIAETAKTNDTKLEMDIGDYTCHLEETCACTNTTNGNYYLLYTGENYTDITPNEIHNLTNKNHTNSFIDGHNLTNNDDRKTTKRTGNNTQSYKNNHSHRSHEWYKNTSNTIPESRKLNELYSCANNEFIVSPSKRFSHYKCNGSSICFTSNINTMNNNANSTCMQCLCCNPNIAHTTIRCEKNKTSHNHKNDQAESEVSMLDKIRRFNEIYHNRQNEQSVNEISTVNKNHRVNQISKHETIGTLLKNQNGSQFINEISNNKKQFELRGISLNDHYPTQYLEEKSSTLPLDTKKEDILDENYVCTVTNMTDSEYNEIYSESYGKKVIIGITSFHLNEYVVLTNITDEYYRFIHEAIEKTDRMSSLIWVDSEK